MSIFTFVSSFPEFTDSGIEYKDMVNAMFKKGIKCGYDPERSRIILYSSRYNKHWDLARDCNGLILDYKTRAVICNPPNLARVTSEIPPGFVKGEYKCYSLNDGTVINLYYYNGSWRIATSRGIDMNDTKWQGITYQFALDECKMPWSELDTKKQYTVGFAHPVMHPMVEKPNLWHICTTTLAPLKRVWTSDIKAVPSSVEVKNPYVSRYGCMFRPKDPDGITYIMESDTMKTLRRTFYDRRFSTESRALGIDREKYMLVVNALTNLHRFNSLVKQGKLRRQMDSIVKFINDTIADYNAGVYTDEVAFWQDEVAKKRKTPIADIAHIIKHEQYIYQWCTRINLLAS